MKFEQKSIDSIQIVNVFKKRLGGYKQGVTNSVLKIDENKNNK